MMYAVVVSMAKETRENRKKRKKTIDTNSQINKDKACSLAFVIFCYRKKIGKMGAYIAEIWS